jgi:hypothetical protein
MAGPYPIPITVGVVGHRDALITREQEIQIYDLFRGLASKFPGSPIYLFSSLADGADRFVAKIFLDIRQTDEKLRNRFELIVPIPFAIAEFRKDFDNSSATEFDQMIKSAKRWFCIGCEGDTADRPLQYLKTGKFVADSSVILLALWDGEKGKKGGTADIVRHKIAGDDENVADSTFEYDGTVFIMPCSRGISSVTPKIESVPLSLSLVLSDHAIREALEKTEEFNSRQMMKGGQPLITSQTRLYKERDKLSDEQLALLRWYSLFDEGSLRFRAGDIKISLLLFIFGFLFIVGLEVYSNLFPTIKVLGATMLLIVIATAIYFYSRSRQDHRKYLINRTLAEALRIQFYWSLAGINRNVSDFFLRIHRKDFTWVKHLLSAIYGLVYEIKPITDDLIRELTEIWVKAQGSFFRSSILRMRSQMAFFNVISNTSFLLAFALLISVFFLGDYYKAHSILYDLLVVIGTLFGIFALIKAYIQMKGYEQLMNQYELMSVIYARAESKIAETEGYDLNEDQRRAYLKELFFVIGKEALIENGNWYMIFKEKEPELEGI